LKNRSLPLLLLILLWLSPAAFAQAWVQKGTTWTHSNGLSVTFPGEFQVKPDKFGFLNATAQGGTVSLVFTPVKGKEQMKGAMKGIFQTMQAAKVELKTDTQSGKQNGLDVAFQEGSTVMNTVQIYVKLGIFSKKEKDAYLLMQLIIPQKALDNQKAAIESVTASIK
jgi:hypothetical protein